ncbi:Rrf2 family transcriptional regulator [Oscillospiraceae bacterium CM]|nr:Rrf2 family transcriptional regulator [Oscillospiraceae bacterium CM]
MKLSAKGRYALASLVSLAQKYASGTFTTVLYISEKLDISKIYLEQVFSLLKRGGLVVSAKGAQGGYQLSREPRQITLFEVLSAVELPLFEKNDATVADTAPEIENAVRGLVYTRIDSALENALKSVTLEDLAAESERLKNDNTNMFYI